MESVKYDYISGDVEKYLSDIAVHAARIMSITGKPVSDEDMIDCILGGLPDDLFEQWKTTIWSRTDVSSNS